jgi:chromosome condensin MukBEF complex kleisin-like MukF subunit
MSSERIAIAENVLSGKLPPDSLTMEELKYIEKRVYELVEEKILTKKMNENKIVFSEVENGLLN